MSNLSALEKEGITATAKTVEPERRQFLAVEKHLNRQIVEREEEIRGLLLSLLAKQHALLLGSPGTGKSLLVSLLTKSVTDCDLFEILMTRFTKPEEVFGPPSLPDLKAGKYAFIKEGTIRESQIAFLDEIFKANSAILNSLLKIVNERIFFNGNCGAEKVPLMSLIGASNELPQGEDLSALFDRFMCKYLVKPIQDRDHQRQMLGSQPSVGPTIYLSSLESLQALVPKIELGNYLEQHLNLLAKLKEHGFDISDRKARESLSLLKANAVLAGREHVILEDARILAHVYWQEPEQVKKLKSLIWEFINPLDKYALEQYDAATEIFQKAINPADRGNVSVEESFNNIRTIQEEVKQKIVGLNPTQCQKLIEVSDKIQDYREALVNFMMGRK